MKTPAYEQNLMAADDAARLAAMQRALPPVRIGADSTAPGGEDPNHTSTATEPTTIGGLNTANPTPSSSITLNPSSAITRAAAVANATAGGPPPGFTGTFGGVQYTGGRPTPTDTSTAAPAPTGSLSSAPAPTGGSLTASLTPPTGKYLGQVQFPNASAPLMQPASSVAEGGQGQPPTTPEAPAGPSATAGTSAAGPLENQGEPGADQSAGSLGALTSQITSVLQGISQSLASPGTPPDVTGVFLQQSQSILKMLDDQEAQLRAENEKAGTTIDPATQFTIDKLRENLQESLKTTREDLNRRGLYDSGIELDLENKLQKGSASDQAGILAQRLSSLQAQLASGLQGLRSQKVSTLSQFGMGAANAQSQANEGFANRREQSQQSAIAAMLNLRGQMAGSQDSALNRAATAANNQAQRDFTAKQAELERQYGDAQNKAKTAAEFEMNKRQFEQQMAILQQQQSAAAAGRNSGVRPTTTQTGATPPANTATTRAATAAAASSAINDYQTSGPAVAAIQARQAQIVAALGQAGYQKLLQEAASLPSGNPGTRY